MSKEKQCECCHEWWWASNIKQDLCPNCYDYFKQLKQELEEKDKEINSLIVDYEKRISQEQKLMSNMEHLLTEKQNAIDEINKEFVQAVHDWKALCAEKDEKIKELKKEISEWVGHKFVKLQYQKAIQELEKLKASADKWFDSWENSKYEGNIYDKLDVSNAYLQMSCEIDQQIKELKGEKDAEG